MVWTHEFIAELHVSASVTSKVRKCLSPFNYIFPTRNFGSYVTILSPAPSPLLSALTKRN